MSLGLHREKVKLVAHNPRWAIVYQEEAVRLRELLKDENVIDIQHIGSTSIPGIAAKPLMGILLVVKDLSKVLHWQGILEAEGYHLREDRPDHVLFAKGPEHNRTIHLHIAENDSNYAETALLFRDYLIAHPEVARQYEELKKILAKKYAHERRKYTSSKNDFIKKVLKTAEAELKRSKP